MISLKLEKSFHFGMSGMERNERATTRNYSFVSEKNLYDYSVFIAAIMLERERIVSGFCERIITQRWRLIIPMSQ
jgi:hypothetical protein